MESGSNGACGAWRQAIGRCALPLMLVCLAACAAPPPVTMIHPPSAPVPAAPPAPAPEQAVFAQSGLASLYGPKLQGHRTASGEPLNNHAMTAAHRNLPFHTIVRVTARSTGKTVKVRINDRGPFIAGRIIDLSEAAAIAPGILADGTAPVRIEVFASDQP
jgi:rare lipoprotein A